MDEAELPGRRKKITEEGQERRENLSPKERENLSPKAGQGMRDEGVKGLCRVGVLWVGN